jgi:transketolase
MLAAQWRLDNLTVILDNNRLQSDGESADIIRLDSFADKFKNFGFNVYDVDGHSEAEILDAFRATSELKPKVIIGNTVKGKGVSFMENDNAWHHNRLTDSLYQQALDELEA